MTHSLSVSKEDSGLAMDSPRSFIVMMKTSQVVEGLRPTTTLDSSVPLTKKFIEI